MLLKITNIFLFLLESLSSIALLDSKILAAPDDPDDIFGMGEHWKDATNGMKRMINLLQRIKAVDKLYEHNAAIICLC